MPNPQRGEVWLIDFGVQGKTRPALVVSVLIERYEDEQVPELTSESEG